MKIRWWMVTAGVIGALMLILGIGNLVDPDDNGPLYGKLLLLAVMASGAALIAAGLTSLVRGDRRGNKLVGFGVLPGSIGVAFFWFPPAVAAGILAIVTSWFAFQHTAEPEREPARS